jgi:hypothetical protein
LYAASGTPPSQTRVNVSDQAIAARSRASKSGESRHTATRSSLRWEMPALRALARCIATQKAQPLICEARIWASSISTISRPLALTVAPSFNCAS